MSLYSRLSNLWIVPLCAVLNRMRGGGDTDFLHSLGFQGVPFRSLFYVTFLVGAAGGFIFRSWRMAWAFALSFFIWGVGPWAHWFRLGRPGSPHRPPTIYEMAVDHVSFGSDYVALFIRHMNILPGLLLIGFLLGLPRLWLFAPLFASAVVGAYEVAWDLAPQTMIPVAELIVGCIWGLMIWAIHSGSQPQTRQ